MVEEIYVKVDCFINFLSPYDDQQCALAHISLYFA